MGSLEPAPILGKQLGTRWFGASGPVSLKGHVLTAVATPSVCVQRQAVGWELCRTKASGPRCRGQEYGAGDTDQSRQGTPHLV